MIQRGATFGAPFLMSMRHLLTLSAILLSGVLHGQFLLTDTVNLAQDRIMDLRFDEARVLLDAAQKQSPNNGMLPYLQSNMVFLDIFMSNDPRQYETSVDSLERLIGLVKENKSDTGALYLFTLSEMYFELGTVHMLFGNNWKSAWAMLDAFGYIKRNREAPETFLPQQLADGVLNVSMGSMPAKYKWLTNMLGYSGDVEKGLAQLRAATEVDNTPYASFKTKAAFVYSYINFFLKADAGFNVWDVDTNYLDSPLLIYAQARIYRERGENEALINILKSRAKSGKRDFYYLDFMLGKAMLNNLEPDADAAFLTFLSKYPGENSTKAANRYLSWHYYLRGNKKLSDKYRQLTLTKGVTRIGADKQALIDVAKEYNLALLKGQLYFDGGYYQKALNALAAGAETYKSTGEKIAFHYRMGRIYQQTQDAAQAIQSYKHVLLYDEAANTFEAGNAALQLGLIYEEEQKNEEAKKYFKLALDQENFPFDDGIHQKAKAGLARLKN
jgi:tetratricopeptide (TPR) repeat protein